MQGILKHHSYQSSYSCQAQCRNNRLHGIRTREESWSNAHDRWVTAVGLSPRGHRVVSGSMDCMVKVWERASGSWIQYLKGHTSAVCSVCLPTECRAVSGSR